MNLRTANIIVLTAATLILAGGCCSKRLAQGCASTEQNHEQTTLLYKEKLRDTVICVKLPDEWHERESNRDSSFLETSVAYSEARIDNCGKLIHTLHNKPVSEPVTITVKDTSESSSRTTAELRTEIVEIPVEHPLSWLQKTLIYCGIMFLAATTLRITLFVIRHKK